MHDIWPKSPQFLLHAIEMTCKDHIKPQVFLHWKGDRPALQATKPDRTRFVYAIWRTAVDNQQWQVAHPRVFGKVTESVRYAVNFVQRVWKQRNPNRVFLHIVLPSILLNLAGCAMFRPPGKRAASIAAVWLTDVNRA
jgi:hypothetical protein